MTCKNLLVNTPKRSISTNAKGVYFLETETNYGVINKKLIPQ